MAGAGSAPDGGAIRLLCMPRVLGHVFNPISVFFCHRRDGTLGAMLYEVHNTFGERHSYLIPVEDPAAADDPPGLRQGVLRLAIHAHGHDLCVPRRAARARPPPWSCTATMPRGGHHRLLHRAPHGAVRRALAAIVLRHGMLSLKVLAAIHWEARSCGSRVCGCSRGRRRRTTRHYRSPSCRLTMTDASIDALRHVETCAPDLGWLARRLSDVLLSRIHDRAADDRHAVRVPAVARARRRAAGRAGAAPLAHAAAAAVQGDIALRRGLYRRRLGQPRPAGADRTGRTQHSHV